jgi:N-acetylglucosaminyldiphosphoundecaprenol N-acetyl-beta-D-mannosaminyltransferase
VSGVRIDPLSSRGLTSAIESFVADGQSHVVRFLSAHPVALARRDADYREILNRGDLNLLDGMGVALALRLGGCRAPRLPGSEGMDLLCRWGKGKGSRHYLYGGTPDVVERLRIQLEASFPGIRVVGAHSPPFRTMTREEVRLDCERIQRSKAELVWVGLGTPKQDFVAEELRELGSAPVILCVGAAFDFLSGAKRRAPRWMRAIGLEWLHRLVSEPRRLWRRYLVESPSLVLGVLRDHLSQRRRVGE